MQTRLRQAVIATVAILTAPAIPTIATAQETARSVSLMAGPSSYDLSGTGTATAVALGTVFRVVGPLLVEPGATYFRYNPQFGTDVTYLFTEVSLQAQAHFGRLYPYLGLGGGRAFQVGGPDPRQHAWTLHGVGGFRITVSNKWGFRGELRVRTVDPFHGTTADFTAGIVRYLQ